MADVIQPGQFAPDFTLRTADGEISLDDLRGHPAVLVFYPADWSSVCGDQLSMLERSRSRIEAHGAQIVGISVDGRHSHAAYTDAKNLGFPLASDFEPKGEVARRYGVYRDDGGTAQRALVVLDADGQVTWSYVSPIGEDPGVAGILDALEQLDGDGGA